MEVSLSKIVALFFLLLVIKKHFTRYNSVNKHTQSWEA